MEIFFFCFYAERIRLHIFVLNIFWARCFSCKNVFSRCSLQANLLLRNSTKKKKVKIEYTHKLEQFLRSCRQYINVCHKHFCSKWKVFFSSLALQTHIWINWFTRPIRSYTFRSIHVPHTIIDFILGINENDHKTIMCYVNRIRTQHLNTRSDWIYQYTPSAIGRILKRHFMNKMKWLFAFFLLQ